MEVATTLTTPTPTEDRHSRELSANQLDESDAVKPTIEREVEPKTPKCDPTKDNNKLPEAG